MFIVKEKEKIAGASSCPSPLEEAGGCSQVGRRSFQGPSFASLVVDTAFSEDLMEAARRFSLESTHNVRYKFRELRQIAQAVALE